MIGVSTLTATATTEMCIMAGRKGEGRGKERRGAESLIFRMQPLLRSKCLASNVCHQERNTQKPEQTITSVRSETAHVPAMAKVTSRGRAPRRSNALRPTSPRRIRPPLRTTRRRRTRSASRPLGSPTAGKVCRDKELQRRMGFLAAAAAEAPFEDSFEGALELVAGGRHPAGRLESIPDRQEVNGDDVIGDHGPGGAASAALQTVS